MKRGWSPLLRGWWSSWDSISYWEARGEVLKRSIHQQQCRRLEQMFLQPLCVGLLRQPVKYFGLVVVVLMATQFPHLCWGRHVDIKRWPQKNLSLSSELRGHRKSRALAHIFKYISQSAARWRSCSMVWTEHYRRLPSLSSCPTHTTSSPWEE